MREHLSHNIHTNTQIGPKVPSTSGRPRAKVNPPWGHMSDGSMTKTFMNTDPTAKVFSPTA